ncbi:exosortase B [Methylotenera sp. 1P/1]|jgi:exosortase B|uniref:exosortase B n=1 Tax=Methylotenera sp. 1P/1 TaxID=1131551 RepID=UPI00036E4CDF|nr:exosortase B [Methylotenera sp. 1P/1]
MILQPTHSANRLPSVLQEWGGIILGLLALYVPMYYALLTGLWTSQDQAHGPIVLMVVVFLAWQKRDAILNKSAVPPAVAVTLVGWVFLIAGLLSYVLGRSQDILTFDIGSQVLVFSAVLLITRGTQALKLMWFPLFFILFMIPLPGFLLDAVTLPMKIAVSTVAEQVLYWAGYPIARSGVVLQIGQYQLLVADACAGMHTLISLEALGLLYLNLVKHDSLFRNFVLALLIIPISFTANVIRVMVLTLVTFYFGDEAGQGFVHGFAGMVLFIVALTLIMSVDSLLQYFSKRMDAAKAKSANARVTA